MPLAERRAHVVWQGNLAQGNGRLTVGTGALGELPISWAARTERPDGKTSPEELIAAAHAGCYAMALTHTLTQQGHQPEQLTVDAVCALDQVDGGLKITSVDLEVHARVPGLDQVGFDKAIQAAEQGCPVSNALRNNVRITARGHLE